MNTSKKEKKRKNSPLTAQKLKQKLGHLRIDIFKFNHQTFEKNENLEIDEFLKYSFFDTFLYWIDISNAQREDIIQISQKFNFHNLITEDIVSSSHRSKYSEVNENHFLISKMLFFDNIEKTIEVEQISFITLKNILFTFQEESKRDDLNIVRERIQNKESKLRTTNFCLDYLSYLMLNEIINNYYKITDSFSEEIEYVDTNILENSSINFEHLNNIRKEILLLKRIIFPMREVINGILKSDANFFKEINYKYYKDLLENINTNLETIDTFREMLFGFQELYINNINLRMNEVMKTLAIITSFMAPATVIGGIFGMNFDVLPYQHHEWGFYGTVITMLFIPILMMFWFKKRKWF